VLLRVEDSLTEVVETLTVGSLEVERTPEDGAPDVTVVLDVESTMVLVCEIKPLQVVEPPKAVDETLFVLLGTKLIRVAARMTIGRRQRTSVIFILAEASRLLLGDRKVTGRE
jgi:hypothetical protein